jgi:hypothetical protein
MVRPVVLPARWTWPLRRLGRRLLWVYWVGCVAVILAGAGRVWPEPGARVMALLTRPVEALPEMTTEPAAAAPTRPFGNCTVAHAAGVYNIPLGSPAYDPRQDGDRDGWACEPPPPGGR